MAAESARSSHDEHHADDREAEDEDPRSVEFGETRLEVILEDIAAAAVVFHVAVGYPPVACVPPPAAFVLDLELREEKAGVPDLVPRRKTLFDLDRLCVNDVQARHRDENGESENVVDEKEWKVEKRPNHNEKKHANPDSAAKHNFHIHRRSPSHAIVLEIAVRDTGHDDKGDDAHEEADRSKHRKPAETQAR